MIITWPLIALPAAKAAVEENKATASIDFKKVFLVFS